jgi:hypothetical protein
MFVYNGLNTLCGVFILHLLRKARGCCMHVFSSIIWRFVDRTVKNLSPSRRREAPCEGTNSPRLFTTGETKALAKSKFINYRGRGWPTMLGGWSSSLISKIWLIVMNSGRWLVQFKVCIITTAWRQRNSKHFLIWWLIHFLQIHFCSHFWKIL